MLKRSQASNTPVPKLVTVEGIRIWCNEEQPQKEFLLIETSPSGNSTDSRFELSLNIIWVTSVTESGKDIDFKFVQPEKCRICKSVLFVKYLNSSKLVISVLPSKVTNLVTALICGIVIPIPSP